MRVLIAPDSFGDTLTAAEAADAIAAGWSSARDDELILAPQSDGGPGFVDALAADGGEEAFHGCFHTVRPDRIVQTFTWEGMPDDVALETLTFEDLGDGRTRLHATSLCDSFEARDAWLRSGMETGVNDGYAAIDRMLADGTL